MAAAHLSWQPVVRLLPEGDDADLLATVRPTGAPVDHRRHPGIY
ncbi:hypothetical protein [Streptomyces sp. NPDC005969]